MRRQRISTGHGGPGRLRRAPDARCLRGGLRVTWHHVPNGPVPPGRIDVLTDLTDVRFRRGLANSGSKCRSANCRSTFWAADVFVRNKRAVCRPKDLADINGL